MQGSTVTVQFFLNFFYIFSQQEAVGRLVFSRRSAILKIVGEEVLGTRLRTLTGGELGMYVAGAKILGEKTVGIVKK